MRQLLPLLSAVTLVVIPVVARCGEVAAGEPTAIAVTIYRSPHRAAGALALDNLNGFAFVNETRTVTVPAGETRVRFEGVADGIDPASAIVTGLPAGVIEKNRDARLLSPSALIEAARGTAVTLLRTQAKTGKTVAVSAQIRSGADDGIVFETADGIEALRCSGLAETFQFGTAAGLSARPTLSVLVRSATPMSSTTVTLAYLARGFDWAANYVGQLSPDASTLDLGAWVTLANSNGVGFSTAQLQVVAGRINRVSGAVEPLDMGAPIWARCWPRGSTSTGSALEEFVVTAAANGDWEMKTLSSMGGMDARAMTVSRSVELEQLGDLKLYRVPERTTLASRQSKQVRLLDRTTIPVRLIYLGEVRDALDNSGRQARRVLRSTNDAQHRLGLPLPSGEMQVFSSNNGATVLVGSAKVRDIAVHEEVEFELGEDANVRYRSYLADDGATAAVLPPVAAQDVLAATHTDPARAVEVTNGSNAPVSFELSLYLPPGARIIAADAAIDSKNGRPLIRLQLPAHGVATTRYQTIRTK